MKKLLIVLLTLFALIISAEETILEEPTLDEICGKVKAFHNEINDYTCHIHAYIVKGKKNSETTWLHKFVKPQYIYMESIEGDRLDSKAYYNCESKKVTGRRGGFLRHIKLTLSLSHFLVQNIRGTTIAESDWFFYINRLRNIIDEDNTDYEIKNVVYKNENATELHITKIPFEKYDFDEARIYFGEQGRIIGFKHYEESNIVENTFYTDITINTGLVKEDLYVK